MRTILLIITTLFCLPLMFFAQTRIEKSGSPDFVLTNMDALNTGVMSRMLFKSGNYYTGAVSTIGTSSNASRLSFYTSSSTDANNLVERVTINNNGFMGINTATPVYPLHLKWSGIGFTQESTTGEAKIGFYTSISSAYLQTHNNVPLYFATNNGSAQMTLTTAGRFGINTSTPVSRLEVKGKTKITQMAGEDAALEISGGIKVSGSAPAAFQVTAGSDPVYITINHPAANGKPDAMLFVTHCSETGNYLRGIYSVKYDPNIQRWQIVALGAMLQELLTFSVQACSGACVDNLGIPHSFLHNFQPGTKFNVMVIER
jgi:hypothetical protein